ncbi:MAG: hypothetical protein ABSA70_02890 [Terriglobia bacterium]
MFYFRRLLVFAAAVWLAAAGFVSAAQEPNLTVEQMREFLLTAKVINSKQLGTGKTHPWRLTLSNGMLTHDAAFQPVDILKNREVIGGQTILNFRDTYHFNIAAYELAKLLGLDDMMPVTVERSWDRQRGALAWWIPKKWDFSNYPKPVPDVDAWNRQMYKMLVFAELVYDTDPNMGNRLITEDWKLWMIDFTRAFRLERDLLEPKNLMRCDRKLLEKLRQLDADELLEKTKPHLGKSEVKAVMARRDKIVAYFDKAVAQRGDAAVLY